MGAVLLASLRWDYCQQPMLKRQPVQCEILSGRKQPTLPRTPHVVRTVSFCRSCGGGIYLEREEERWAEKELLLKFFKSYSCGMSPSLTPSHPQPSRFLCCLSGVSGAYCSAWRPGKHQLPRARTEDITLCWVLLHKTRAERHNMIPLIRWLFWFLSKGLEKHQLKK